MEFSFIEFILGLVKTHAYTASFVGAMFGGEETIIVITMLAAGGIVSLWSVFIFSFLGTIISDSIWFYAGKTSIFNKMITHRFFAGGYNKLTNVMDATFHGNRFLALLTTKFLYGTRVVTIMYISREKIPFLRFTVYNALTTAIWLPIVLAIGWFAGKGFGILLNITKNVQVIIISIIAFVAVFYLLRVWINKLIARRQIQ
jgi:membrane protein DedA with SNARE-associated domain